MFSLSRRSLLAFLIPPAGRLFGQASRPGQGMASRGVQAARRRKFSGLPFAARFTDVAAQAGLTRPVISGHPRHADYVIEAMSCGAAFLDYDNDGWLDILVLTGSRFGDPPRAASNRLYRYNRDGRLDLFVANYVTFDQATVPRAGHSNDCNSQGVFCGPRGLPYGSHSLYHNEGDGTFRDVTAASGIGKTDGGYGLTVTAADFDNDGWPDIYVACDSTPSLFFHNNRDGTFTEQGLERGVALSDDGMEQAGMGVAIGDFRLEGRLDILKTHFAQDTPALYLNDGKGGFSDLTLRSGLAVETRYVSWGAGAPDLDNDGCPDIFWVTGGIYPEEQERYRTPRVIFRNLGNGQFEELPAELAGPAIETPHSSRGCAFGDFDNDGDVDVLVINHNEPPSLLRNDLPGGHHYLKIRLTGVQSNRSAIGARVLVRYGGKVQAQEVLSQSSYLSVNDPRLHFGLGTATRADVEIRWPLGRVEKLAGVEADQLIHVTEGAGITHRARFRGQP